MIKQLTAALYGVKKKVHQFQERYPDEKIFVADGAKAVTLPVDRAVTRGGHWVSANRGVVIFTNQRIVFEHWNIPLSDITATEITEFKSVLGYTGLVVKIVTRENQSYQFGLSYDPTWLNQKVLKVKVVPDKFGDSWVMFLIRIVLIAYIGYFLIKAFTP